MLLFANLIGILLIVMIVWWFWLYKTKTVRLKDDALVVIVDNGIYTPSRIEVEKNKPFVLTFLRKDASPCSELLLIPDLNISETLEINKPFELKLPPIDKGEYKFSCQMKMYRGLITVQ